MPRQARRMTDGGIYHVLTRGNNRQRVFHGETDYQDYLQLLSGYLTEHRLKLYHFALMPTHVHLVLEAPLGQALSRTMLGLSLRYTLLYQKRHQYSGHLWQGRFKSLLIDRESDLLACGRYVELNPVLGGLVKDPGDYTWSSYQVYAEGADHPLVTIHPLYSLLGASVMERQLRYRQFVRDGLTRGALSATPASRFFGAVPPSARVDELFEIPRNIPTAQQGGEP